MLQGLHARMIRTGAVPRWEGPGRMSTLQGRRPVQACNAANQSSSPASGALDESLEPAAVARLVLGGMAAALAASAGGLWIDAFSTPPCTYTGGCQSIPLYMKVPLVATHLFPFLLLPATMLVFHTRAPALKAAGARDVFTVVLGLSFLMVAIAGEVGWHVTQDWFYVKDYSLLNCFFYVFLSLGTSLWAIGIETGQPKNLGFGSIDLAMLATPVLVAGLYMAGAAVTHTKVPIYGLLAFQHAVLTHRFWRLLKTPEVFLFPFFCVAVNLGFIVLLNLHASDPVLNPLFHILHDALGTEMGVASIAAVVYYRLQPSASGRGNSE